MRWLVIFVTAAVAHFVLSVLGTVFMLPAAFETQGSFWDAPVEAALAWLSSVLLAPLALLPQTVEPGYLEIATCSALFGAVVAGLARWRRPGR